MMNENVKLHHGDCLEVMDKLIEQGVKVDVVITDPPYLHNKGGNGGGHTKIANSKMYSKDSMVMKHMSNFTPEYLETFMDKSKKISNKINIFAFCNDSLVPFYCNWAIKNNLKYTILVWEKPLSILNRERYSTNLEYIVRVYGKGTALRKIDFQKFPEKKDYYSKYRKFNQYRGHNKLHPAQKPYDYIVGLVELNSDENDVVLDPFMGSGSTGVACVNTNRKFVGIELDENYFKIAEERIHKALIEKENI